MEWTHLSLILAVVAASSTARADEVEQLTLESAGHEVVVEVSPGTYGGELMELRRSGNRLEGTHMGRELDATLGDHQVSGRRSPHMGLLPTSTRARDDASTTELAPASGPSTTTIEKVWGASSPSSPSSPSALRAVASSPERFTVMALISIYFRKGAAGTCERGVERFS